MINGELISIKMLVGVGSVEWQTMWVASLKGSTKQRLLDGSENKIEQMVKTIEILMLR